MVEDYKTPGFKISLEKAENKRNKQNIELKGNVKTFSGINLSDVKISYTVDYGGYSILRFYRDMERISSGSLKTDNECNYNLEFEVNNKDAQGCYKVNITATDKAGETQEESFIYPVGNMEYRIYYTFGKGNVYLSNILLGEYIKKISSESTDSINIKLYDHSYSSVAMRGELQIY